MISFAFILILDAFLYSGLVYAMLQLEHKNFEARVAGRKLLGLGAFGVVLANRALLGGVWFLDVPLILVAAIMYHRAATEAGTRESVPVLLITTALTGWLYLHPVMAPVAGGGAVEALRGCHSNVRTLTGGIEMYLLDKNVSKDDRAKVEELTARWASLLTEGKYIQSVPRCGEAGYSVSFDGKDFQIACGKHGSGKAIAQTLKSLPRPPMTAKQVRRGCRANLMVINGATEMFALDKLGSGDAAAEAAKDAFDKDWSGTLVGGGYMQEEPECEGAPRGKPEGRYTVARDGTSFRVRCPVHGTREEMAAKHPDE